MHKDASRRQSHARAHIRISSWAHGHWGPQRALGNLPKALVSPPQLYDAWPWRAAAFAMDETGGQAWRSRAHLLAPTWRACSAHQARPMSHTLKRTAHDFRLLSCQ